jgi:hypothetical protein|tara:strand:+ start:1680 stop:2261 length:582 start_codon:yes stop_codon:yes gene_type:complete
MKSTIMAALSVFIMIFMNTAAYSQTNTVSTVTSGTVTVDKTPPTASAPSIVVNNSDVCKSAFSAGVQTSMLGIASGITITDENCERLKLARSLYGMGMKVAAVSAMCQDARVFDAMLMAGTPCPYKGSIGNKALKQWKDNPEDIPSGSRLMAIVLEEEGIEDRTEDRKNDDYPFIKKSATIPEEEDPWATEGD